jgi:hypothetical protein
MATHTESNGDFLICKHMKETYLVIPGTSWGSLTIELQRLYNEFENYSFNNWVLNLDPGQKGNVMNSCLLCPPLQTRAMKKSC